MIVRIETAADEGREFFVPQAWQETVMSLLESIDKWVMAGAGEMVKVHLTSYGPKRIHTIQIIRRHLGVTIREGKILTDLVPCHLPPLPHVKAQKMIMDLQQAGATAEMPSAIDRLGALAKNESTAQAAMAALNGETR